MNLTDKEKNQFWARTRPAPESGCVLWLGTLKNGYGQFSYQGKGLQAHRVAYELVIGPIPKAARIGQSCGAKDCCNPNHLTLVKHAQNNAAKGETHYSTKLTGAQATEIRSLRNRETVAAVAKKFGVSSSSVSRIQRGLSWRE